MKNKIIGISIILALAFAGANFYKDIAGAVNFDRIVLGTSNYDSDPNPTADVTMQNDEYITNVTDGLTEIVSPSVIVSSTVCGTDAFTTTSDTDHVDITGALSTDIYLVSGFYTAGVDQQDVLEWQAYDGYLKVWRLASGESALIYSWLRFKQ